MTVTKKTSGSFNVQTKIEHTSHIAALSHALKQGPPNYSPRAKSGLQNHFIWPAKLFHPAAKTFG